MASELAADKPHVISQQEIDDLRALSKRHADTGELFAYEPGTGKVEVYTPAAPGPTPAYVYTLASRPPVVHVPERREPVARPRERRAVARRASTSSRGSPDDPDPEPPAVVHLRGFTAASVRMVQHCERRRAAMKWA